MTKELTFNHYQSHTNDTAIYPGQGATPGLMYVGLGLGEAGEIQNKIKKVLRDTDGYVSPELRKAIGKELGDLLWYVSQLCWELSLKMEDVANENLRKLLDRKVRGVLGGSGDER